MKDKANHTLVIIDDLLIALLDDYDRPMMAMAAEMRARVVRRERDRFLIEQEVTPPDPVEDVTIKPIEPLKSKRVASIDVPCPSCKAKRGEKCFKMDRRGPGAKPIKERATNYHKSRAAASRKEGK